MRNDQAQQHTWSTLKIIIRFFLRPFDGWQRNLDQQRPPPQGQGGQGGQGQYSLMNKGPRSPLLNPQAEPWRFGSQQNAPQNQQMNNQVF